MQLNAKQRQHYLQEMGIQEWYPRYQLPQAPKLVLPALTTAAPAAALNEHQATTQANSATTAESLPPTQVVASQQPDSAVAAAKQTQTPVRFGLAIYLINDWLVCSSLTTDYQQHSPADLNLIQAILKTLGNSSADVRYHHLIAWPFFSNPHAAQGIDSARQYVNSFIEHLTESHQINHLISFGGVLARLSDWKTAEGKEFGLQRLSLPSVYKMLQDSRQKQRAWQLIRESAFAVA